MSRLAFALSGPVSAPLLVLLHGFLGSRRDWIPVTALLPPGLRILACDLPGHGATGDPGPGPFWSLTGCAAKLARLIEQTAAGPATVVGYSLGGRLALHLAMEHPRQVAATVLVSASPGIADAAVREARRTDDEKLAQSLEQAGLTAFLDAWYRQPLFASLRAHPSFPDVLARRRENDPHLLVRSLRTMGSGSQRSLWEDLPRLQAPLLALAGERDPKFAAIAQALAEACGTAAARIVPGCGHALIEENPAGVAGEIVRFISRIPG